MSAAAEVIVPVALGDRSYDIMIADGLLDQAGEKLKTWLKRGRAIIVTDAHVAESQLPRLVASLETAGISAHAIILPAGESTKSWEHLSRLVDDLLKPAVNRVRRTSYDLRYLDHGTSYCREGVNLSCVDLNFGGVRGSAAARVSFRCSCHV